MRCEQSDGNVTNNSTICVPFTEDVYIKLVWDPFLFRSYLDKMMREYPEIFPHDIRNGYRMKDFHHSKKLSMPIRRIEIGNKAYGIRPSFLMHYMTGRVAEIENALFMRKFHVPYWAISHAFGRNPMYWERIANSLGRNSLVGATIRNPKDIPRHIAADEKHSRLGGDKHYVAMIGGGECILCASITKDAGEESLTAGYGAFKSEARALDPDYSPDTCNIDGWKATRKALTALFPSMVVICCFLHIFIKMRDRAKKKYQAIFKEAAARLWECYKAENRTSFSQRVRRLSEWCDAIKAPNVIANPITKLRQNLEDYAIAYLHPGAHRTSNMLDRLMRKMDRYLFNTQYFHGSFKFAELNARGWALIQNFAPSTPRTVKMHGGLQSPAERLNRFRYSESWLENLLISASMGGYRPPPQNPL